MGETLHGALHPRDERRAHTELVHAQAEQQRNQRKISRHFAAYAHPDVVRMGGVRHHLEQAQDRRMRRRVEMRDSLVHPVHRDRILNEIVRADAEKIHLAREPVSRDGGARNLDHRADFCLMIESVAFALQVRLAFRQASQSPPQFLQPRDHREHDLHVPHGAGANDRAQLRFEDVGILETKTNGPLAQERIQLIIRAHRSRHLVAPQIKGPNDQRMRANLFRHFSIGRVLLLFTREGRAIQVEKFRPIKANAFRSIARGGFHVVRQFDVS